MGCFNVQVVTLIQYICWYKLPCVHKIHQKYLSLLYSLQLELLSKYFWTILLTLDFHPQQIFTVEMRIKCFCLGIFLKVLWITRHFLDGIHNYNITRLMIILISWTLFLVIWCEYRNIMQIKTPWNGGIIGRVIISYAQTL